MKYLYTLIVIFYLTSVQAQPGCQFYHTSMDDFPPNEQIKGSESLRSDTIDVLHYAVYLDFTQASSNQISGNCKVLFNTLMDVNTISLDLLKLNVDSVIHQGNAASFTYNDTLLVVDLGGTLTAGQTDSVQIYYNGTPQTDPSGWGGFYMNSGYYYNLGVGFGSDPHNYGRVWHPCFDNFVERATYDFEILTANNNTAYCNGTRTSVQNIGTDSLLTKWELYTEIPSYLASVAVSNYTHVTDNYFSVSQGINIPVWLASHASDTTNLKGSFANLNNALEAFENFYGPYVWERVGYVLVPFNAGAMEHATNIAYPLVTVNGMLSYETLMAHELSHHWWGDWVTCSTAEEMWINEGMATYSENLFLEYVHGGNSYIQAVRANHYDVLHRAHIDDSGYYALNAVPLAYTYGEHSYNKGADVMHTLRGYLGDSDFFTALQAIQTAYGGSDISSEEFRDEINTLTGVDVSDFFNDWIFQAGFSHFSVSSFNANQNGNNYDVSVIVDQKLRGAPAFHQNVPLTLTFMDANWNTHTESFLMSGDYQQFNFSIPFNPVFVAVNMDEKINDATTAQNIVVSNMGIKPLDYANARLDINQVTDSAFVRVEHNWVYADNPAAPENTVVSFERYWNIHGIDLENIAGSIRFEYNGKNDGSGGFDNQLLQSTGSQAFTEDSLVLLYRPNDDASWVIHSDYTLNTTGSKTDKFGFLTANTIQAGEYCFGYKTNSVGIEEKPTNALPYSIYPNPTDDCVFIDLSEWKDEPLQVEIYAINGQHILSKKLVSGSKNKISVEEIGTGTYLFILTDGKRKRFGSKRVIIN